MERFVSCIIDFVFMALVILISMAMTLALWVR